jgi:hypothetical protein
VIALLQRLGHREAVLGFVGWGLFAALFAQVASQMLAGAYVAAELPFATVPATIVLGALIGRSVSRRGVGVAVALLCVTMMPLGIAGAIVTWAAPHLGGPLLLAPTLLAVGGAIGIALRRQTPSFQNPGSAAIGAAAVLALLFVSGGLALGAMDALWGAGVREVRTYLADYDCLDPERQRLARAIHSFGSPFNRQRIEQTLESGGALDVRPCKD